MDTLDDSVSNDGGSTVSLGSDLGPLSGLASPSASTQASWDQAASDAGLGGSDGNGWGGNGWGGSGGAVPSITIRPDSDGSTVSNGSNGAMSQGGVASSAAAGNGFADGGPAPLFAPPALLMTDEPLSARPPDALGGTPDPAPSLRSPMANALPTITPAGMGAAASGDMPAQPLPVPPIPPDVVLPAPSPTQLSQVAGPVVPANNAPPQTLGAVLGLPGLEGISADGTLLPPDASANGPVARTMSAVGSLLTDPHTALGAASFAPSVFGAAASAADGLLYAAQGDRTNAAISLGAAALGVVSDAGAVRLAAKGVKAAEEALTAERVGEEAVHGAEAAVGAEKIQPKIDPKAGERLDGLLSDYQTRRYQVDNQTFQLDKGGIQHVLERHAPEYWDGTTKTTQTFFPLKTTVSDVQNIISDILTKNRNEIISLPDEFQRTLVGVSGGKEYQMSIYQGRITQLTPLPSR